MASISQPFAAIFKRAVIFIAGNTPDLGRNRGQSP